jgi:hypothetical protein
MTDDRATYDGDGDHLDEVVIHNATVHIERMDAHNWMVMVTRGETPDSVIPPVYAHFNAQNLTEVDDMQGVPYRIDEPLAGLCHEWTDRHQVRHQCFMRHSPLATSAYHKCSCGRRTLVRP